jgi:hypothetical protein
MGPMTGRAAGYCAGYGMPGYANPIPGRGGGWGWGRGGGWGRGRGGWGRRNWFYATGLPGWQRAAQGMPAWGAAPVGPAAPTPDAEKQFLSQQVEALQQQLDAARKRLDELATQETE